MEPPVWNGGEPMNLPAASMDALQWLRIMSHFMSMGQTRMMDHAENLNRLNKTIACLEAILLTEDEGGADV